MTKPTYTAVTSSKTHNIGQQNTTQPKSHFVSIVQPHYVRTPVHMEARYPTHWIPRAVTYFTEAFGY